MELRDLVFTFIGLVIGVFGTVGLYYWAIANTVERKTEAKIENMPEDLQDKV